MNKIDFEEDKNGILCAIFLLLILFCLFIGIENKKTNKIAPINLETKAEIKVNESDDSIQDIKISQSDEIVLLNTNSMKFHKPICKWAMKCKNCVKVPISKAKSQGGIPCKVCHKN